MPRRSYDEALRSLAKGEPAPVYYLYGTEAVLQDELVRAIIERALPPAERDLNLDQRDAAALDPEALHALVNTLPMLAARRVVVLRGVAAWKRKPALRTELLRYLDRPAPETILVLLAGDEEPDQDIAARAVAVQAEPLEPARVIRWIGYHAGRHGMRLAPEAAEHLARLTGYDLGALRTEIEKLSGLAEGTPITSERVSELVGVRHGETLEDWCHAVLADETARALRLMPAVLDQAGMSGVRMVAALGAALLGVQLARGHYDRGVRGGGLERLVFDRIRQLRLWGLGDWRTTARNWARWAQTWPLGRLRAALGAALEADRALKGARISGDAAILSDLVLRLAEPGGAAPRAGRSSGLAATPARG
ncbi:MAG TPA: DNA polymerase III subunit delta [Gemmatimonadales bacterium]|jgi:DNA polymerase-3 subunit delta|nr:DNA polymerase III subunit delta [Gemmatimonadales bacterium]